MAESFFEQSSYKDKLIALLIRDRKFLRECHPLLDTKDFSVNGTSSKQDKIKAQIAQLGLNFYEKYNEPLGSLITAEVENFAKKNKLPDSWKDEAVVLAKKLLKKKVKAPAYISERVVDYKSLVRKKQAIDKLHELQEEGKLTDESWTETCSSAIIGDIHDKLKPIDFFSLTASKSRRIRRKLKGENRFPVSFIEPLDRRVRLIARGHLGLVLAPYKRGKSLFLMQLALAYVVQRLNVLYFTLEDPKEDVEDRFDSAVSFIPIKDLAKMPKAYRKNFAWFKRNIRTKLKIVDGTDGGVSIAKIKSIIEQEYNKGFPVDALIIDYDEYIQPKHRNKDRRFEFDEVYRDLKGLIGRMDLIAWTASQSKRGTVANKIITGDDAAEDVGKIRKANCVLSLGQGDWGEDGLYIHVAAHKHDRQHVGVNIMSDLDRMRIYDPIKTAKAIVANPEMKRREK